MAQPEQEAPKEKAPAQAARPLPAQAAQQPAQAVPHPVSEATQATPGAAVAPVKKEGTTTLQCPSLDTGHSLLVYCTSGAPICHCKWAVVITILGRG